MTAGLVFIMSDHPQDTVYSFVERAYIRLQVGDVLSRCLENGTIAPIREMVEGLVLAGPQNLATMRDILEEAVQRRTQVQDDLHQVFAQFGIVLKSYGIKVDEQDTSLTIQSWTAPRLSEMMQQQGVEDTDTQKACLQIWQDSCEIMDNLSCNLNLLGDVELYLQDWMWGLAFQTAHRQDDATGSNILETPL